MTADVVVAGQLARDTLTVSSCKQTFDHPASAVSDHYGLVADLTLPPHTVERRTILP
ncbi:MAG: hypothetical protein WAK44_15510 [Trebonia sp.]|jgi:hypothetical protein|uniref:hypothetical protein n=1 Tax=Trebonia sp. TaxID=2767075 RepID=UPI003BB1CB63